MLTSTALLVHYDPTKPLVLSCDASPYGVGAVLSQVCSGEEKPVAYASRRQKEITVSWKKKDWLSYLE